PGTRMVRTKQEMRRGSVRSGPIGGKAGQAPAKSTDGAGNMPQDCLVVLLASSIPNGCPVTLRLETRFSPACEEPSVRSCPRCALWHVIAAEESGRYALRTPHLQSVLALLPIPHGGPGSCDRRNGPRLGEEW